MMHRNLHDWNISPGDAVKLQRELSSRISLEPLQRDPALIAGADVSFEIGSDVIHAGFVVLDARSLRIIERVSATVRQSFPYIPGLLTFREGPALIQAWEKLRLRPDVVFFDGQGIAHPRRMGIASHLGLWIDLPSVGCAKSLLCGGYEGLGEEAGSISPLIYRGNTVGVAYRTRARVAPVYISPGHRIDLKGAVRATRLSCGRYRIPEPTRQAHLWVNEVRRAHALRPSAA